ncbi:alpha/beta fold hydrolase [Actinoplanes sp. CA-015351]|uniref:alpha/beta fold hydrolase n=1 Tax=Actinoplanes sp. CA-015351 TaxID=3239897 RepID=UPI003D99774D
MSAAEARAAMAAPRPDHGFTSRRVTVGGLKLHVRSRTGSPEPGIPWVLLHGLAVSHRYLMPTALALPGDVYVPDLPGFGLSENPRGAFDVTGHATAMAGLMDAEGLSGAVLLGNSFGCQVAVELAVRRPELAAALVLVGPTVDPDAPTPAGQAWRWVRDLAHEDPQQARIIARDVRDAGVARVLRTLRHSTRHPMAQRLPLVAAPVLVLRGEHDPIAPPSWIARAARLAATGRSMSLPRAAHNAVTTAGPELAAEAVAFVHHRAWSAGDAPAPGGKA